MKILALDIETRPALVYTWSLYQPIIGIEQIVDPGGMFCFAAKWVGETRAKVKFYSDHHHGHEQMLGELWSLLDEADAVLHFNGTSFDVPHCNREFMEAGMSPPAPFKQIDLYRTVRTRAKFLSNKLAFVAPQLGLAGKVKHEGFGLWRRCMEGETRAWQLMKRYNVRDVTELEAAYQILLPWIPNHPSHAASRATDCCPKCGADGGQLQRRGVAITSTGRYQRFQCKACAGWSRGTKREAGAAIVQVA